MNEPSQHVGATSAASSGQKKRNIAFWVVVCGGAVLLGTCVLGIVAAVAIPAYVNYFRRAKAEEVGTLPVDDQVDGPREPASPSPL